jgi:PKD repeat protein
VTVSDANLCEYMDSIEVTEPVVLDITVVSTDVSCNGASDGTIDITVTGGVTPYSYWWSNSAVSEDLTQLGPGTFDVTVSDANGCEITGQATLTQADELLIDMLEIVNESCPLGASDGSISISVIGGTSPYIYNWTNDQGTVIGSNSIIENLGAGMYYVTVTDATGCYLEEMFEVQPGDGLPIADFLAVVSGGNVIFYNTSIAEPGDICTWDFGDGSTIQQNVYPADISHTYAYTDTFQVTLIVTNDCGSDTVTINVYAIPWDINELAFGNEAVTIYPNPNNGEFDLRVKSTELKGEVLIRIMDATGRVVVEDNYRAIGIEEQRHYDMSRFSYGTYMVQILTNQGSITKPVIISRR